MKKIPYALSFLSIIALGTTQIALAEPTSLGIGIGWENSPYKSYSAHYSPIPHIDYDNGLFFIDDLSAGFYVYHSDEQSISLGARYLSNEFKPHNSDNHQLKQLDSRHATLLTEIEYSLITNWGVFSSSVGADMLNKSNSILVNSDYTVPYMQGNFIIAPTIGINWANGKHNSYYYGISHKESSRSGLRYVNANSSLTPYAEIAAQYSFTENMATFGGIHIDKLTGDAADSPMVDKSTVTSIYMGVSYNF
ncbi:outer membrane protein [Gilliamella bombicola]|uniref:Outer membrane protein n=1 Tax=Gilliamella bombicola TaxID=1798182 RepID=A0A1C4BN98_9GAMM|nr:MULTISPECIES: MipA/OmpV family protein [Gilliamella]NUF27797.1 MipA/OmpV family protein [Gilliamella sp. ESL0254]SCC08172.1 outer membrane protein [Gilliamella bombicola]